ncbi:MAG TPA: peroxide stress protein YaaA [Holophagaceae bacterium]|nr:peroxide stress protein YaaA [Holophagaceae bacterium]
MKPLILLAPSEDKAPGGKPGLLAETPAQRWVREKLHELVVHAPEAAQRKAFDVKEALLEKAKAEALALHGPVPQLPALKRYTGVAFGALDAATLPKSAWKRVWVLSNLRGLVRGDEPVPPYKLKLSGLPGLKAHWQKALPPLLAELPEGAVWALLPNEHADFLKGWDRPRHTAEIVDAKGKTISHWSKLYRGKLARWILDQGEGDPKQVAKAQIEGIEMAGLTKNAFGGQELKVVVTA